jgi:hypothetical protein
MLGRKDFRTEEIETGRKTIEGQIEAYRGLVAAVEASPAAPELRAVLAAFEPGFLNTLVLALDRFYVHRLRSVTGKGTTPLNELELVSESLMHHDGILRGINAIAYTPGESVVQLEPGDRIALSVDGVERLADGVFGELERKYVKVDA